MCLITAIIRSLPSARSDESYSRAPRRSTLHSVPGQILLAAVWTDFDLRSPALTRSIICLWDNSRCVRPPSSFSENAVPSKT